MGYAYVTCSGGDAMTSVDYLTPATHEKGSNMHLSGYRNTVLKNVSPIVVERLQLKRINLPRLHEMERPLEEIRHLIFLEDGIASMTTLFANGDEVEVALAGYESVLGASSLLGTSRSLNRVYMQIGGWGYTTTRAIASEEFARHGEFERLVLRYTQAQFIQTAQTAACNASHTVKQRLARWLLLCSDRMESDVLELSQEFTAEMLGNRRTSVSVESGKLQEAGLISYTRSKIKVLDRPALERIACECYGVVRKHLTTYESSDEGFGS